MAISGLVDTRVDGPESREVDAKWPFLALTDRKQVYVRDDVAQKWSAAPSRGPQDWALQ